MAPTSHRYSLLSMDESPENLGDRKLPVWVGILLSLLVVVVVGLSVAVGVLAAKANSPACKDGLRAEQECRNITHLLEQELTQAQEVLRGTEAQAATCNQTVETLMISLKEKAGGHKQQELVQKLQGEEIKTLNQSLQNKSSELQKKSAELEQLRSGHPPTPSHAPSSFQPQDLGSPLALKIPIALGTELE
uniref:Bone marrow stromal antigen 2 n=1 Tax=Myotis lucifugus TaxID=59463 RepID=G1Q1P5_MYOLU